MLTLGGYGSVDTLVLKWVQGISALPKFTIFNTVQNLSVSQHHSTVEPFCLDETIELTSLSRLTLDGFVV